VRQRATGIRVDDRPGDAIRPAGIRVAEGPSGRRQAEQESSDRRRGIATAIELIFEMIVANEFVAKSSA